MHQPCPCGSGKQYADCCEPYHLGAATAPTAEALMRSRYSAYALNRVEYLRDTLSPEKQAQFDLDAARRSMKKVTWTGLTIHSTRDGQEGDQTGEVEFTASYRSKDIPGELAEHSRFERVDGRWVYVDGEVQEPEPVRDLRSAKVGRNQPCPCGSGKKYKKCCG